MRGASAAKCSMRVIASPCGSARKSRSHGSSVGERRLNFRSRALAQVGVQRVDDSCRLLLSDVTWPISTSGWIEQQAQQLAAGIARAAD